MINTQWISEIVLKSKSIAIIYVIVIDSDQERDILLVFQ